MGQLFIDEVRAIVLKNIANDKFGVGELADSLDLSKSQTLRKIKAATGKSVNQYIRELRLEKAAKLIKKTDDSIAEISYQVGFSSPSYFTKTFVRYYGISPGEYKTKSASLSELAAKQQEEKPASVFTKKRLLYLTGILILLFVGYIGAQKIMTKSPSTNSIAVLPFKDFSPEDNQWFSDGVSDNILHTLAQMHDLSVTSFTSSATYRDTDKQIPEIAKELGVAYVLEGSVTLYEDDLKILVQLIDANDKHVWSKEYNESFNDVIAIQNSLSQEVMDQLELTLSLQEEETVNKLPTENMEAYSLYLEGRRINQSIKQKDLEKNIANNQKAIALDSNFVDAYVELATTNMIFAMEGYSNAPQYIRKAATYVDKALELDPNSGKANAVKARILLGNDWSDSEIYFKKALAINSNDAELHHWYAFYFLTTDVPDLKKALEHASIANELSPFSSMIATRYVWTLVLNEQYAEAETYLENYEFLIGKVNHGFTMANLLARKNHNWAATMSWLYNKLEKEPEHSAFWNWALTIPFDQLYIDHDKANEHAKKAYELDSKYLNNYLFLLSKNGFFQEAERVMQTDDFKGRSESFKSFYLWVFHYYKGDYIKALSIIKENPGIFRFNDISMTYAQLGDRAKLDSVAKEYYLQGEFKYETKSIIYAILNERDSMYYYLDKLKHSYHGSIISANMFPEFAPYKKEERLKTLLLELYIPAEGEQYVSKDME